MKIGTACLPAGRPADYLSDRRAVGGGMQTGRAMANQADRQARAAASCTPQERTRAAAYCACGSALHVRQRTARAAAYSMRAILLQRTCAPRAATQRVAAARRAPQPNARKQNLRDVQAEPERQQSLRGI